MNDNREVEYFLPEEECTHTPDLRDKGVETGLMGFGESKRRRLAAERPGPVPLRKNNRVWGP